LHYLEFCNLENGIKQHFHKESLKEKLKAEDELIDVRIKSRSFNRRILISSIGLAAGLALVFGLYLNNSNQSKTAKTLWPYEEGIPVQMGHSNKYNSAMNAFKVEDWNKAFTLFSDFESDTATYFAALSQYQLEKIDKASKLLSSIDETSAFYMDAEIRIALIRLQQDHKDKAIKLLNKIRLDENHKFYDLAGRILNKI
jgi:predicted negative regulator of RcsB-dependent stress response